MDIKAFYRKMREIEQDLPEGWVVVMSLQTGNGGRAGIATEVRRDVAARMIAEGRARVATEAEVEEYRTAQEVARVAAEEARRDAALRTLMIVPEPPRPVRQPGRQRG